jgi:hypothetical protein
MKDGMALPGRSHWVGLLGAIFHLAIKRGCYYPSTDWILGPHSHFCPQHADRVGDFVEHDALASAAWDDPVLREFARYGLYRSSAGFDLRT